MLSLDVNVLDKRDAYRYIHNNTQIIIVNNNYSRNTVKKLLNKDLMLYLLLLSAKLTVKTGQDSIMICKISSGSWRILG